MKWTVELVNARHIMLNEKAYLDPKTNVCVPMLDGVTAQQIIEMEEHSDANNGALLIDITTSKIGLIVR